MKAITVREPWATLIVIGRKPAEYRGFRPTRVPLRLVIHAAVAVDRSPLAVEAAAAAGLDLDRLPAGVLLGEGTVVGTFATWADHPMRRYGRWTWVLKEPVQYRECLPARGQLGLWDVNKGMVAAFTARGEVA